MNFFNIKKLAFPIAITAILFSACKKPDTVEPLADQGEHFFRIVGYGGTGSDFGNSSITFSDPSASDEAVSDIQVVYETSQVVTDHDITITLEVDTSYVAKYNLTQTDPLKQYHVLPTTAYDFAPTTVTIKAGTSLSDFFSVNFHPDMVDGSINLMLPIRITNITGAPSTDGAAPSSSVAYFHFIGNPLAGTYDHSGMRYNYTGVHPWHPPVSATNAIPAGYISTTDLHTYAATKFAAPVDALNIIIDRVANTPPTPGYYIAATGPATDPYSTINVAFNSTFTTTYSNLEFTVDYTPPTATVKPAFTITSHYNNAAGGSGDDRIIVETFVHQ